MCKLWARSSAYTHPLQLSKGIDLYSCLFTEVEDSASQEIHQMLSNFKIGFEKNFFYWCGEKQSKTEKIQECSFMQESSLGPYNIMSHLTLNTHINH